MIPFTIRLNADTLSYIEKAAKKAGIPKAAYIRYTLEQIFDGRPHNPLGVTAYPPFYDALCEAIGVMCIQGDLLSPIDNKIAKKKAEEIRRGIEIDREFLGKSRYPSQYY